MGLNFNSKSNWKKGLDIIRYAVVLEANRKRGWEGVDLSEILTNQKKDSSYSYV